MCHGRTAPAGGFLRSGIAAPSIVFASITPAIGLTDDANKGIVDRFRSLPMARSAVLTGRAVFDLVHNTGILAVLMEDGLAVGWRVCGGVPEFFAGVARLLAFVFAPLGVRRYRSMSR